MAAELHKLDNGMEVLFEETHSSPVISFHMLVKAGSAVERTNEAGICHVIEHMLFKGTPTREVGAIARDVEAAGGEINAYTSFDQTVFYINMASRFSKKGLLILADAVQNPLFDETELEREKEVILEEIRRDRDNPSHRCNELSFTRSYRHHPYKNPIIGTQRTVRSFSRKQIMDFYRRWYTPVNMTLVVVGEFEQKSMMEHIKKAFKGFRGKKIEPFKLTPEPASRDIKICMEENPIHATYFSLVFHIPNITNPEVPALDVLSHILAGTDSSRLEQVIKEQKRLVNDVYSYAFTPKDPGLFFVGGIASPKKTFKAISAIWDEIHKLHSEPISVNELNRAKLNIRSSEIYEKETTSGLAGKLAYFMATAGTHLFEQKYYQMLQNVRVNDVRLVAQKYLVPENTTLVVVHPKGDAKLVRAGALKSHIKRLRPTQKSLSKVTKDVSPAFVHRLPNGIRLVMRENHALPIVSLGVAVHGGLRFEERSNNGINNLLARTITKGTKNKSAMEIAEEIESIAGNIDGFSGRNSFGMRAEFLSDNFNTGFDLFAEVLTEPSFTDMEISKEKAQVLDAIKNQEDALMSLTFIKFLAALFPHHPYGMRMLGEKESVKGLNRKKILDYYHRLVNPKDMVISVVGDISPSEVIRYSEKKLIFPSLKGRLQRAPRPELAQKKAVMIEYKRPEKEQAHIVMGFLGPRVDSKDRYIFSVLNNILSGQGGRLFLNLRDKMSLAYAVNSTFFAGLEPGYFAVYIGTEPSKVNTAVAGIKKELMGLIEKGPGADELARSKNHLMGAYEMERQRSSTLAANYAFNLLYGLGIKEVDEYPDKINAVTHKDILNTARKYFRMDSSVTSIVRPK